MWWTGFLANKIKEISVAWDQLISLAQMCCKQNNAEKRTFNWTQDVETMHV